MRAWINWGISSLRALSASGLGPVQWTLAFAPIEAAEMPDAERHPHHTLAVDVAAALTTAGRGTL
jgi:hypothetical protein